LDARKGNSLVLNLDGKYLSHANNALRLQFFSKESLHNPHQDFPLNRSYPSILLRSSTPLQCGKNVRPNTFHKTLQYSGALKRLFI